MKTLVILTFTFLFSASAIACSGEQRASSQRVQDMMRGGELATWQEKAGVITLQFGSVWDTAEPDERIGLVQTFANSDACLAGRARTINFYRVGKLVAKASPTSGIRLIK